MKLRPFFSYFGSKWSLARHYPEPIFGSIIEPFAGSAGYSLFYPERRVLLVDSDPVVAGLWDYLIRVSSSEILKLPAPVSSIDEIRGPQEARWLVGFWLGRATAFPRRSLSKWGRDGRWPTSFWGEYARERIASQVDHIRHWRSVCADYNESPNEEATWFVDPPYQRQGIHYRSAPLDYSLLASWCRSRPGQALVCENDGASWMPFKPFRTARANSSRGKGRVSRETLWQAQARAT